MVRNRHLSFFLILFVYSIGQCQVKSVLNEGTWIKLSIDKSGIYQINYNDLQSYGLDPSSINPKQIRLFGHNSGMLPQLNTAIHQEDLEEVSILVTGEADGIFNMDDEIIFYGQGPNILEYDSIQHAFFYENNIYSDHSYYYLTIGNSNGLRIGEEPLISGSFTKIKTHFVGYVHEEELTNILHSGRKWYGESFDLITSRKFNSEISEITPSSDVILVSSVMAASSANSSFDISVDGNLIGQQTLNAIPQSTYTVKGDAQIDTLLINSALITSKPLTLDYRFNKTNGIGYLDYFVLTAKCNLVFNDSSLTITPDLSALSPYNTYEVSNAPDGLSLWNITDNNHPSSIAYSQTNQVISFNATNLEHSLILFNPVTLLSPTFIGAVPNQNLHGMNSIDFLIITAPELISAANELSGMRAEEGIKSAVVTTEQVYNEFSAGKPDISAIRNFARQLYKNGSLKYLLILGKGTYDFKNINGKSLSLVPIYESRNSLQPLSTYGSDDYLGFLDDGKGVWPESGSGDELLDIGVGRIPASNLNEAEHVVEKLRMYREQSALGQWRKEIYFVAEDGDVNIHQRDADRLASLIDTTYAEFNTNKIFVDAYPIEVNPGFKRAPEVNRQLFNAIQNGAFLINYTGHGNEVQWANTKIFDLNMIDTISNKYKFPLFITATCEFGRHDDDSQRSGAEKLLIKHEAGSIGMVTTARPVFSSSNYLLNLAFYQQVFQTTSGRYQRLGDIFKKTKNNSLSGVLNRNFSLLGDPSMRLSYAGFSIQVDSLNGKALNASDTLKSQEVSRLSGTIRDATGQIDLTFYGKVMAVLFDKPDNKKTLGNSGAPFSYQERDNVLFRGEVTARKGQFTLSFVLPKDISYRASRSKLSFYASADSANVDASGANINLVIGVSSSTSIVDNIPPTITAFIGDSTFSSGSEVQPNTLLIAKFSDDSGINISSNQIGHSISMSLDGGEEIILNDFYSSVSDNYKNGILQYPLSGLKSGNHSLIITAWDASNNQGSTTLTFIVSKPNTVVISQLSNYPNPMSTLTHFTFSHNLSGEDINVTLEVMSRTGQLVYSETRSYLSAPSVINDWQWDGRNASGGKLNKGLYIYGIIVRSINNTAANKRYSRLIISN